MKLLVGGPSIQVNYNNIMTKIILKIVHPTKLIILGWVDLKLIKQCYNCHVITLKFTIIWLILISHSQRFTKIVLNFVKMSPKLNVNTRAATTTSEENECRESNRQK